MEVVKESVANPGIISGKIHDHRGQPIADVRVYFSAGPAPFPEIVTLTNEDGTFIMTAPQQGRYVIESTAEGFAPRSTTVTAAPGKTVHVDIEMKES